jgi:surfactin synthase thioesterase subunit
VSRSNRPSGSAEVHLLDGGHFVLESRLGTIVALIRPFLEQTADA